MRRVTPVMIAVRAASILKTRSIWLASMMVVPAPAPMMVITGLPLAGVVRFRSPLSSPLGPAGRGSACRCRLAG